jgi:hypothetical protein
LVPVTGFPVNEDRTTRDHGTGWRRFGDALNLNLHFHTLVLDGVYAEDPGRGLRFRPLPPPTDAQIERIAAQLARRLERLLERRDTDQELSLPPELELGDSALPQIADASVRGRLSGGARAGQRVLRLGDRIDVDDLEERHTPLCARVGGVSLHAGVSVPAHDRRRLERLCRYVARPPIATARLSRLADGRLLYALKRRWRDGTTHVVFEPLELCERIVALIPPPRAHLVRYHGVLRPRRPRPRQGDRRPSSRADSVRRARNPARSSPLAPFRTGTRPSADSVASTPSAPSPRPREGEARSAPVRDP